MLVAQARGMPVDVADERLGSPVHDLHRPSRPQREHARMRLHREVLARPEGAPDARHREPDLLRRQPQAPCQLRAVDVQPLRGDIEIDAAFAVWDRETRLGAEGSLVLHADLVLARDHNVRVRVLVAMPDLDPPRDIAIGVQLRRVVGERHLRVGEWSQDSILDTHCSRRAPRALGVIRGDQRHRLAPIAHHVRRQYRLVWDLQAVDVASRHVLVREDGQHARHRSGLRGVDGDDARVWMRAAHRGAPEHALHLQVRRIREVAPRFEGGVGALDRVADAAAHDRKWRQPGLRLHDEPIRPAARCTASMILA